MDDLFGTDGAAEIAITRSRKISGLVARVYRAAGKDFVTEPADALELGFDGIAGDFHAGITRLSGGREPWYPRGTEMRNERQLSIVAPDELAAAASAMEIDRIAPEWIGANLLIDNIPHLSMLPPRTLLFFEGGVTLKVDGQNAPCRLSGSSIADQFPDRDRTSLALSFKDAAKRRRGLVAWVEKPGTLRPGERVTAQLPEQWIYG